MLLGSMVVLSPPSRRMEGGVVVVIIWRIGFIVVVVAVEVGIVVGTDVDPDILKTIHTGWPGSDTSAAEVGLVVHWLPKGVSGLCGAWDFVVQNGFGSSCWLSDHKR